MKVFVCPTCGADYSYPVLGPCSNAWHVSRRFAPPSEPEPSACDRGECDGLVLCGKHFDVVVALVENPPEPTQALIDAFKRYDTRQPK